MPKGSKNNRVIIRIWCSGLSGGANVGHISIETPNAYMSLWPDDPRKDKELSKETRNLGLLAAINKEFKQDADEDYLAEGRVAEKIICLYSLDIQAIEARFKEIYSDPNFRGWTLLGNNILLNRGNAHSCASLAYTLLKAGGIYELISSFNSSYGSISSAASPDALAGISIKAKQAELISYPDTKKFEAFARTATFTYRGASNIEKTTTYTEKETKILPPKTSYYNCTTATLATTVVGLFAVGTYCYFYPEKASEHLESLKPYFRLPGV